MRETFPRNRSLTLSDQIEEIAIEFSPVFENEDDDGKEVLRGGAL